MNILRIIPSVDPAYGGPAEGLKNSAMLMAEAGHSTEVVSLDTPDAPAIASFPVPVHGQGPVTIRYGYTPRLARWIAANAVRFDVAVIHGLWSHASIGGWLGCRRGRLPYVVFTHGMLDPWFRTAYPLKHWAKQAFWLLAQGRVLSQAHAVLFTSETERRLAANAFIGPKFCQRVVAYGAAGPPGRPDEQAGAFHAAVPALGDRPYLLFLGRIHPKKGCDLLVPAFIGLAQAHPEIDLVIAGPDRLGLRPGLQAMADAAGIGHRLHWPGLLQGDAKWGAFRSALALALPSHQENFGIAVAEALACGTPVLVSDKIAVAPEIAAAGAGLVAPDTLHGTADLLARFLRLDDAARAAIGASGRLLHAQRFSLPRAAADLEQVLREAIGQGPC